MQNTKQQDYININLKPSNLSSQMDKPIFITENKKAAHTKSEKENLTEQFSQFEQLKSLIYDERGQNKQLNNALTKSYCNNASIIIVLVMSIEIMNLYFDYSKEMLIQFCIISVLLVIAEVQVMWIWSNLEDIEYDYKDDVTYIQFFNQMWLSLASMFFKIQQNDAKNDAQFTLGRFLAVLSVIKVENLIMSFNLRGLYLLQDLILTQYILYKDGLYDKTDVWMTSLVTSLNLCQFYKMYITQRDNQAQLDEQEFRTNNSYLFFHDMRNYLYSSTSLLKDNFLEALEMENMSNSNVIENITVLESNVKVSENLKQLYSCELFFNMTFQVKASHHDSRSVFEFINNKIRVHLINKKFKVHCRLAKNALATIFVDKQLLFVFVLSSMMAIIDLKVDSVEITWSTKQLDDQQYFTIKFETDNLLKTKMWKSIKENQLINRMMRNINKDWDPVKQHFVNFEEFFELRFTQPQEDQGYLTESKEETIQYNRHNRDIANYIALVDDNEDMASNNEQIQMIKNKVAKSGTVLDNENVEVEEDTAKNQREQLVYRFSDIKKSSMGSIKWQNQQDFSLLLEEQDDIVSIVNTNMRKSVIKKVMYEVKEVKEIKEIIEDEKEMKVNGSKNLYNEIQVINLAEIDIQVDKDNTQKTTNSNGNDTKPNNTTNPLESKAQKGKLNANASKPTVFSSERKDDKSRIENLKITNKKLNNSANCQDVTENSASELQNSVQINVDDESSILNLNKKLFGKLGHFLICCGKGLEFQEVLKKMQNDSNQKGKKVLAIMDYKLDGEFGDEIIIEATQLHTNFKPAPSFELKFVALSSTEDKNVIKKLNDVKCLKIQPKPLKKAMVEEFSKFVE